jgi:hypothetical protein
VVLVWTTGEMLECAVTAAILMAPLIKVRAQGMVGPEEIQVKVACVDVLRLLSGSIPAKGKSCASCDAYGELSWRRRVEMRLVPAKAEVGQ